MKAKKLQILTCLFLFCTLITGCSSNTKPAEDATVTPTITNTNEATKEATPSPRQTTSEIKVMDMAGSELVLTEPAEKVVALTAADCEILYALGAGNTLVGRGEYCNYPEEINDVAMVQSGAETNIEQIIALKPQIVIMSTMAQTTEQVDLLKKAGISVLSTNAQNIEETYTAIELIGSVVGKNTEAAALIDSMKKSFAEIEEKAAQKAGSEEKTVYFEVSPLEYGLWTSGNETFMNELANMLHLKNTFEDVTGWAEISEEQVLERNPDYIVTVAMYFGEGVPPVDEILNRKGWKNLNAIQNQTILNANSDEMSRPGPRLVAAANALYTFIYGE